VKIRCCYCEKNNQFKGKASELARGMKIICSRCHKEMNVFKKPNGKFSCQPMRQHLIFGGGIIAGRLKGLERI